jgi:hypothetical protein
MWKFGKKNDEINIMGKFWITVTRVTVKLDKILVQIRAQRIKLPLDTSF